MKKTWNAGYQNRKMQELAEIVREVVEEEFQAELIEAVDDDRCVRTLSDAGVAANLVDTADRCDRTGHLAGRRVAHDPVRRESGPGEDAVVS